ncbi:MAG: flagellar assembly protein FliH [Caulobacteraceae bacterium]|nr:flagellar assembly protein FliH [Caulobacteraceae bacterium]
MTSVPQKFAFDTVFDGAGTITQTSALPKRLFPAEEVERIRAAAFAEGERAAITQAEAVQAQALSRIAEAAQAALPRLAEVAHEHRAGSAQLALACGRTIADAALELFPQAPVKAALESLAREVETTPKLVVTAGEEVARDLAGMLDQTAQAIGYAGQIVVRAEPGMPAAAFTLDFGDGSAAFDPDAAARRVAATLEAALAAEGLHAEPLIPASES